MDYRIKDQRLILNGEPVSLFSGSYQYWRIRPELWRPILARIREMGFEMIETYMPWSVHEVCRNNFDFGELSPNKDVAGFLTTCGEEGVKVLARPGPHINAELTYFGYPERIFSDREIYCRSADGSPVVLPAPPRMFPVPCYHHPGFLAEVSIYINALADRVRDLLHPHGPVVAIQVDNECSKFFRTHPFDHDYSAYSIRLYRRFLREKYQNLDSLNRAYRAAYHDFELVDPPRSFTPSAAEELPYYLDWVEFSSYYITRSLKNIAEIITGAFGNAVPLFHNYPTLMPVPPFDMPAAEEFLDFQGVDAYPTKQHYHTIRKGIKYTSASSRLPMLVEFSSGGIYFATPITLEDQRFTTWSTLMHGIKGINFYMIVERERWYGSPIKSDGSVRQRHFDFYRDFLSEVKRWGIEDMRPDRPVLLLVNREYERLAAAATMPCPNSSLIGELTGAIEHPADLFISSDRFGLGEPVACRYARIWSFWYWSLTAAGVRFAIGDTSFSSDMLSDYRLIILPTFEFLDRGVQQTVLEYLKGGGTVVVGPRAPIADELLFPCELLSEYLLDPSEVQEDSDMFNGFVDELLLFEMEGEEGKGSPYYRVEVGGGTLVHLGIVPSAICGPQDGEVFGALIDTLMRIGGVEMDLVPSDSRIDVSLFTGADSTLLMVANPTDSPLDVEISNRDGRSFTDLRSDDELGGSDPLHLTLESYTIRVLREV